ncbi:Peptidoglycan-recognition protein LF, partial [Pseudolycoriella hygida]
QSEFECNGKFGSSLIEQIEPFKANIGNVSVENSTNVTIGNNTYFNGPVTITNFVVDAVIVTALGGVGYYLYKSYISDVSLEISDDFELIDRNKYGALLPKNEGKPLALPVRVVIISHTVTPNCTDYSHCASRVLQIQGHHMNVNGWDDIGLNFLVGGDGRAYEGCGYTVGAHTKNYNAVSICIGFIGDFRTYEAPEKQLKAAQRLIDAGVDLKLIHPEYVVYGQRQLRNLDSPGILLYNQIMLWPHWQVLTLT